MKNKACETRTEKKEYWKLQGKFMSPSEEDKSYLSDINDACSDIIEFTRNLSFHDFKRTVNSMF